MATIKNPVTIVKSGGGGGGTKPTTWAEFKAMTVTQQQQCYSVGSRVGIACSWAYATNRTCPDLVWEIGGWGTTKLENDATDYPCVILIPRLIPAGSSYLEYDAPEQAVVADEATAQAGVYYFGVNGSTYTALNLSVGDTIPYGDYTQINKTDVSSTNGNNCYSLSLTYGLSYYPFSALRQWMNAEGGANSWWVSQHIGDMPPTAASMPGFMNGLPSDFKAILSKTQVAHSAYSAELPAGFVYDYFFAMVRKPIKQTERSIQNA